MNYRREQAICVGIGALGTFMVAASGSDWSPTVILGMAVFVGICVAIAIAIG